MTSFERGRDRVREHPSTWLVTGAAGFIGSSLVEFLLGLGQRVVGLDNFSTGSRRNVAEVLEAVGEGAAEGFRFIEGDIRDPETCRRACEGVDLVLHQAALGSVPRSIDNPVATHQSNVDGFLNVILAAHQAGVKRFVYAASSSTYGDHPGLPRREDVIGRPLSPYAVTKYVNELYAGVFQRVYGLECIGLRYFNVFGRRQNPEGAYAAVIPRWVATLLRGERCRINGDGETSRDFCYVDNVLQANLLAATCQDEGVTDQVYNVAYGDRITLNRLFALVRDGLSEYQPSVKGAEPEYTEFRAGDVRHSLADIGKISRLLGYHPTHDVERGMREALAWYAHNLRPEAGMAVASATPG
jgi:UDP-N-acetylglucosamine 4-epimerase